MSPKLLRILDFWIKLPLLNKTLFFIWEMLTSTFSSLRCFSEDWGMIPSVLIAINTMKSFKIFTFGVLDLDIFNFPLLGNFNPVVCRNSKINYLGFLVGFIYNNHLWSSMLNYIIGLNIKGEQKKRLTYFLCNIICSENYLFYHKNSFPRKTWVLFIPLKYYVQRPGIR